GKGQRPGRRDLLARFSPVAIPAFLVTVGTGYVRATQELHALSDLYRSPYGRVLSLKILAVGAMVPLSVMAWRRLITRPRAEAVVALVVVAAAGLLAAFPLPPARVAEAGAEATRDALASGLPEQGDLTLGGDAGEVLVGVTLRPGTPGPNTLLVYVLPLEGEEKAGEVRVDARLGTRRLELRNCGPACRRTAVGLEGGEQLTVRIPGAWGGEAIFAIPPLPAPDGAAVLATMEPRMAALQRLRIDEVLRPAKPPLEAHYALAAPDRFRMQLNTGAETITIGDTRYARSSPVVRWEVQRGVPPTSVPFFIWSPTPFIAPRIVGSEQIEGRPTQVVSFFEDRDGTPIWFRVWVDADGLVHRAQMRAHGHFMDHRYFDFDAPLTVDPP
ncbi:MAG: CopD family protein, partial [Actinomycetota bacterium]